MNIDLGDCLTVNEKEFCDKNGRLLKYYLNGRLTPDLSHQEVKDLDKVLRSLGEPGAIGRRYKGIQIRVCGDGQSLMGMTAIKAAETVLRESGPLTIVELVIALQSRGCRSFDDPRKLAKCLRSSFYYHRERIRKDRQGRWALVD